MIGLEVSCELLLLKIELGVRENIESMAKNVLKRQDLRVLQSIPLNNASLFVSSYFNLIIAFLKLKL